MGNINNHVPSKRVVWRCDTYVAWDFYRAGYSQLMNLRIMLPLNVYNTFPYANNDALKIDVPSLSSVDKEFIDLSAEELNNLGYPKFVELADIPMTDETPSHIAKEWEFANSDDVVAANSAILAPQR